MMAPSNSVGLAVAALICCSTLLNAITEGMIVVFGFYDCDRDIGFVEEDIVCPFILGPGVQFATDNDPSFRQGILFAYLSVCVPSSLQKGRGNTLGADVTLRQLFFIHSTHP